jgi:hypothetical protein
LKYTVWLRYTAEGDKEAFLHLVVALSPSAW